MSVRTVWVYWKMTALGAPRLNERQTLSSVHVVILFMWRFASGIVALKKTKAYCSLLCFCLAAAPRLNSGVQIRGKLKIKSFFSCEIKPVNPIRENLTLNTIMYSIYRLKGYKSEAVASRRLCVSLLGDCCEAGAYAFHWLSNSGA